MISPRLRHIALLLPTVMVAVVLLSSTASASSAGDSQQPVRLSAKPVDQPGAFFDLTLNPGEQRQLSIALGNHSSQQVAARTYAADVQTIVNGGFGAGLRDEPPTGTTTWLDYKASVLQLPAGQAITRSFTVRVPPDTPAGEYITSLILENDEAVEGTGAVALDQVVRQAVAVAIRVPGDLTPALKIGDAQHTVVADRSVVAVHVANPGNARLKPTGQMLIRDDTGQLVSRAPIAMDSFYSHTTTLVEATLATSLQPGAYTVDLTLTDTDRGARASATDLPLTVQAPPTTADQRSAEAQVVDVLQSTPAGMPIWATAAVLLLAITVVLLRHRRARPSGRRARPRGRRVAGSHAKAEPDMPATLNRHAPVGITQHRTPR